MRGVGVHPRAVCSFQPQQLKMDGLCDTVQFFHGLSGLEAACDSGVLAPGSLVLFNGASLLLDVKDGVQDLADERVAKLLSTGVDVGWGGVGGVGLCCFSIEGGGGRRAGAPSHRQYNASPTPTTTVCPCCSQRAAHRPLGGAATAR